MPETVRYVSDGEELVLWEGEAVRLLQGLGRGPVAARRDESLAPKRIVIQYLGFQDIRGRREYRLQADRGELARCYTVWIELSAFSGRRALLQDGPDICYQKLLRELAGSEPQAAAGMGVTDVELAAYRESHVVSGRKRPSRPPLPRPADEEAWPIKGGNA